ncbi:Nucleotide-binding alpha-beta plait [Penicillium cf. griseofulvum]|uniref:Nucleotide-binding alpha-beta plait n=1 Tax=Penicillium cf. griseofulvum TaxID=2972120 RepID=A0A9W9J2V6_9EURO|nr:Nucleotide-binding alpha-beta plait [Penicillium cf. griseofulvum]KAJ5434520.1 Nucleotide-binding alpha-beta plait [Penicillium cf. griseofulvum]KAJ5452351.1 Nucleotide-binding alpha-beta plait [Penicillium cf. griseofulvum]
MLKPFQIRNLRVPSQHQPEQPADSRTSSGVVQISATDYDDLASNHPRARLTYLDDDDDDETITVGSAFELSQRLEEPLDLNAQLESVQLSPDDISPMHIFDIRRSNSVTELWKRFENSVPKQGSADEKNDTQATSKPIVLEEQQQQEVPVPHVTSSPSASGDQPRPFMEAFEAELAEILNAESSESRVPQPNSPPTTEPSANTNSRRSPHPVEILAAQVLDQLINGATMVQSEFRSKIPELQRQLHNAQRQFEATQKSLPKNVESSLRTLLATVEAHLRTAFNNLPDGGRQMAEDAFQAGRPVAENAADGFRTMASELNEVGRTLFAAFESEFGRARPTASMSSTSEVPNPGPSGPSFNTAASNESAAPGNVYSQSSNAHPSATATKEKSTAGPGQSDPSYTAQAGVTPIQSHHSRQPIPAQPIHWAPPSWPAPLWNPFHTYNAPPPPYPPLPSAAMPNFTYFTHGRPAPPPPPPPAAFNTPVCVRQASQVKSGESTNSSATRSLFIGNVGFKVTDKMIQDVFAAKGFLVKVDLPLDTASGRHAGFGYVNFPSEYPAFAAIEALQGAIIDGHSINLEPMHHPPIESVRPVQVSPNAGTTVHDTQADMSGVNNAPSERNSTTLGAFASPLAVKPQKSSYQPSSPENRRKSVSFVDLAQNADCSQAKAESSALLDSPGDDPAFSARFPSLLPETSAQHNDPLSGQGVSSYSNTKSRFPPVSQWEAQLLANRQERRGTEPITGTSHSQSPNNPKHGEGLSAPILPVHPTPKGFVQSQPASQLDTGGNIERSSEHTKAIQDQGGHSSGTSEAVRPVPDLDNPQHAAKLKRRATEHETHKPNHHHAAETGRHNPLKHSASMRRLGDRSQGPAETDTWARLSRRERNGASSHEQIPGSFPVEDTTRVELSSALDASVPGSNDEAIERCVSSLIDMGYGAGQEGGRSRMAVYAAMVDGVLMDAIDMIEEERQVYERRPSQ